MENTTHLDIPELQLARAQGMGGYDIPEITEMHSLFEVPSLGIAGDMVMSLAQEAPEPVPNFRVTMPAGARPIENPVVRLCPIGAIGLGIKQLAGQGITASTFPKFERNTRFHLRYMKSLSDIIGEFEAFRSENVCFAR
jgi:hypothetical protein